MRSPPSTVHLLRRSSTAHLSGKHGGISQDLSISSSGAQSCASPTLPKSSGLASPSYASSPKPGRDCLSLHPSKPLPHHATSSSLALHAKHSATPSSLSSPARHHLQGPHIAHNPPHTVVSSPWPDHLHHGNLPSHRESPSIAASEREHICILSEEIHEPTSSSTSLRLRRRATSRPCLSPPCFSLSLRSSYSL